MHFKSVIFLPVFLFFYFNCSSNNLSYDGKIKKLLDKKQLSYEIDKDGDFKISVPLAGYEGINPPCESVWIISSLKPLDKLKVREVFSVCLHLPTEISTTLLQSLMSDNYNNRFLGAWSILETKTNTRYLIYLAKLPTGDLNFNNLMPILQEVGQSSYAMREILLNTSAYPQKVDDLQETL